MEELRHCSSPHRVRGRGGQNDRYCCQRVFAKSGAFKQNGTFKKFQRVKSVKHLILRYHCHEGDYTRFRNFVQKSAPPEMNSTSPQNATKNPTHT